MDQVEVEVDKRAKNIKVNIQSNWLNKLGQIKDLLDGQKDNFVLQGQCGKYFAGKMGPG